MTAPRVVLVGYRDTDDDIVAAEGRSIVEGFGGESVTGTRRDVRSHVDLLAIR